MTSRHVRKLTNQRSYGIGRASSAVRGNNLSSPNKLLTFIDEREAAERFSAVVVDFSSGELAQLSRSTKGSAKNWKAARYFPNGASLINLAKNNPAIRKWLLHEIGETAEFDDPRAIAREIAMHMQQLKG